MKSLIVLSKPITIEDLPNINDSDLKIINNLMNISDFAEKNRNLFQCFYMNLCIFKSTYNLNYNDEITKAKTVTHTFEDIVALNTLLFNLLCSSKSLIESIDIYFSTLNTYEQGKYSKLTASIYDNFFSYRFLIRLRDFYVHGNTALSYENNKIAFNLNKILNTAHFNHNKKLLKEIKGIHDEIIKIYKDKPNLIFTFTILEYVIKVIEIYLYYCKNIQKKCAITEKEFKKIVVKNPQYISNDYRNSIIYKIEDNNAFTIRINNDFTKAVDDYLKEARNIYKIEVYYYDDIKKP